MTEALTSYAALVAASKDALFAGIKECQLSTGQVYYLRLVTVAERERIERAAIAGQNKGDPSGLRRLMVRWCLCTADGELVFKTAKEAAAVDDLPAPMVEEIVEAARLFNGMVEDDDPDETAEALEAAAGKS